MDGGVISRDMRGLLLESQREKIVLRSANAIQTPMRFGDGLHDFGLEKSDGLELGLELAAGFAVGGEVVGGQDDSLAGKAVAQGVQRGAALALGSGWSGGARGVLTIDGGTGWMDL